MEKWTPQAEWLKLRLKDYNLTADSDFYEYVGKAYELEDFFDIIRGLTESGHKLDPQLNDLFEMSELITKLRYNYFSILTKRDIHANLSEHVSSEFTYAEYVSLSDTYIQKQADELYTSLSIKDNKSSEILVSHLRKKLTQSLKREAFLYEKNIGPLEHKIKDSISVFTQNKEHPKIDFDASTRLPNSTSIPINNIPPQYVPRYSSPAISNNYYSNTRPPIQNIQLPKEEFVRPYINVDTHIQDSASYMHFTNSRYQGTYKQSPQNTKRTMKKRTRHMSKKMFQFLKENGLKIALSTGILIVTLAGISYTNDPPMQPTPAPTFVPIATPANINTQDQNITISQDGATVIINSPVQPSTAPIEQQTETPAATTSPTVSPYKKGTLMYNLHSMDDETIGIIANSLRESITGLNGVELNRYGNGCNSSFANDREYVAHVFSVLDKDSYSLNKSSLAYDPSIILPQMEQLATDLTKYIIASALNESGLYNRTDYTIDDIDFYSSRKQKTSPEVGSVTVRTIKEKDGKLVQDQLIGNYASDYSHFPKDLGRAIQAATTLTNTMNDVPLGMASDVAADFSLLAYQKLVILTEPGKYLNYGDKENPTNLKITRPGKSMKLETTIDNDR